MSNKPLAESGFHALYRRYKAKSKIRGYKFTLTKLQFKELTSSNCFYCNRLPSMISYDSSVKNTKETSYTYNGIDRVNNKIGYTNGNVVACCKKCNEWKRAMPVKEFVQTIHKVSNFLKSKGFK